MSTKFKVGDRIKVYTDTDTDGIGLSILRGTVTTVTLDIIMGDKLEFQVDDGRPMYIVWAAQCRKLKPKKEPRKFWINNYGSYYYAYDTKGQAYDNSDSDLMECIEVVEVRKKKV